MLQSNTIAIPRKPAAIAASSTTHGAIVFVQLLIFVVCGAVAVAPANFFWRDTELIYPCCLFVLLHSVWALWSWKRLSETLVDPYAFVYLSALLFNAGQLLLEVFGLNK